MTLVRHDAIYFVALSLQPWFPNEAPRCPFSDLRMLSQVWFCCFLRHKFVLYIAMRGRNRAHFKYRPLALKNPEKTFLTIFERLSGVSGGAPGSFTYAYRKGS